MTDIFSFNEVEMIAFSLVLLRMSAFVVTWPVFGISTVPTSVKILFALITTMIIFPQVGWSKIRVDMETTALVWLMVREIFLGLVFGFIARMFFFAFNIAGEIVSVSMGLSGVQLFNPTLGRATTPIDQIKTFLATLLFLGINGHHIFIEGIVESFSIVPMSVEYLNISGLQEMGSVVHKIVVAGVKIASPVMISIMLMNICMGVIGRTVPQINVLITSLPVNILVGFSILIFSLPMFLSQVEGLMGISVEHVFKLLKSF